MYELLNQTAPNRIAQNNAIQSQTKACIVKLSCEICALVRYYTAWGSNSLPIFQVNLLIPVKNQIQKREQSMT